jgi:hypothetical protein
MILGEFNNPTSEAKTEHVKMADGTVYDVTVPANTERYYEIIEPTSPDAGTPDAGTPDSGTPDSGTPDAGRWEDQPISEEPGQPDQPTSTDEGKPDPDQSGKPNPEAATPDPEGGTDERVGVKRRRGGPPIDAYPNPEDSGGGNPRSYGAITRTTLVRVGAQVSVDAIGASRFRIRIT